MKRELLEKVKELVERGASEREVARQLGLSRALAHYYASLARAPEPVFKFWLEYEAPIRLWPAAKRAGLATIARICAECLKRRAPREEALRRLRKWLKVKLAVAERQPASGAKIAEGLPCFLCGVGRVTPERVALLLSKPVSSKPLASILAELYPDLVGAAPRRGGADEQEGERLEEVARRLVPRGNRCERCPSLWFTSHEEKVRHYLERHADALRALAEAYGVRLE